MPPKSKRTSALGIAPWGNRIVGLATTEHGAARPAHAECEVRSARWLGNLEAEQPPAGMRGLLDSGAATNQTPAPCGDHRRAPRSARSARPASRALSFSWSPATPGIRR